ncbi:MAG: type I methionyl aminopeptidase [Spirochaetaceae bacterium]|nr:MAG: type I methionyl aminopeptidase [Spirochaetaceae bacterium]
MIRLKNHTEIGKIREAGFILSETLEKLKSMVEEGITTGELDSFARDYVRRRGAEPAFLGYLNFPASLCVSINEEVIHGIPGKTRLKRGDIVGLDLGVNVGGYYADAATTLPVGNVSPEREKLLRVAQECLDLGIEQAVYGNRISHISQAIYNHAKANSFEVVRQYCGHGVGFSQHEEPQIPNYVSRGPNPRLKSGMILALEPMINRGSWEVQLLEDNWTVVTADHSDSAHFEHTIAIHKDFTEILTLHHSLERV